MSDFKEFKNPWSAESSEWFGEEKDKWFEGGEFNEWIQDKNNQETTTKKGGHIYSFSGKYYGKLENTGLDNEIYVIADENVELTEKGTYIFKNYSLLKWFSGTKVLKKDFDFIVATLYAESSGEYEETLGIYNVCENRANQDKVVVLKVITTKQPYGVAGSSLAGRRRYIDEKGPKSDSKRINCHKAFIDGVLKNEDVSNGAFFWDGIDFSIKGSRANINRYQTGYKFTKAENDIWNQGNNLLVDEDGNPTGFIKGMHGKYSYKYESVNALGNTLFTKLSDNYGDLLFRKADGVTIRKSNWNGSKPLN